MSAKRVAILISGGGSNMIALVHYMHHFPDILKPILVLSNTSKAHGLRKAADLGVPIACEEHTRFSDRRAFEQGLAARLHAAQPDIICLAGFMRILSKEFLQNWPDAILNIHPSLLPRYRGLDTHQRAIEAGDRVAGCSVHIVTPALDAGPILGQATVPVHPGDDAKSLAKRVLKAEHVLYPRILRRFAQNQRGTLTLHGRFVYA